MPDPITLPHPIRSEQERENVEAAYAYGWRDHVEGQVGRAYPPVEPLPELPEPFAVWGKDGEAFVFGTQGAAEACRKMLTRNEPHNAPFAVARLAVVEVLDPEPEPPKAAPSGRRYIVASRGKFSPVTLTGDSGEVTVIDAGWDMISLPPCDLEHVAALLREAEHGK